MAGRPKSRKGNYERITLEVRKDILARMDALSSSRRAFVEQALLERISHMAETQQLVNFVIGFRGLETSIAEFFMENEWYNTPSEELPPNTQWEHVSVASEADMNAYIAAQNRYLEAAWTPNQTAEREENSRIMAEAQAEMGRLRKN
jgi:hypothetical protein